MTSFPLNFTMEIADLGDTRGRGMVEHHGEVHCNGCVVFTYDFFTYPAELNPERPEEFLARTFASALRRHVH